MNLERRQASAMDLSARPLQYFAAVARDASFSRAAERLNVAQPSLSAQIRELERRLGFRLFERSSRKVELTREGRLFLPEALRMIAEASRLNRAARDIRQNDLRIGAALYTVLIPERTALIEAFLKSRPGVTVDISNRDQLYLFNALRRGDMDLALAIGMTGKAGVEFDLGAGAISEIVVPELFERLDIAERPIMLAVPATSPLASHAIIPLEALEGVRIAMLGAYHGSELIDAIAAPLEAAGVELVVPPEGNAIAVERYGVLFGMPAISIGWFQSVLEAGPPIVRRPVAGLDVITRLALLRPRSQDRRPASDDFWAFAAGMAEQMRHRH